MYQQPKAGFTVWLTGLPASGKSTLAKLLADRLRQQGLPVQILDGDEMRKRLTKGLGYSREDREENVRRIAYVASLLTNVRGIAIVAAISPYARTRLAARAEIKNFVEVYVQCPLSKCMERDPKGLYAKATRGEISNFTGLSDPYEHPQQPEITVYTDRESESDSLQKILDGLIDLDFISKNESSIR